MRKRRRLDLRRDSSNVSWSPARSGSYEEGHTVAARPAKTGVGTESNSASTASWTVVLNPVMHSFCGPQHEALPHDSPKDRRGGLTTVMSVGRINLSTSSSNRRAETGDFEIMARRITTSFNAIGETPEDKTLDATQANDLPRTRIVFASKSRRAKVALVRMAKRPGGLRHRIVESVGETLETDTFHESRVVLL